jgi:hypothetical protein
MLTVLRYDDCTPKVFIAKAIVQRYASTAFDRWSSANPTKSCPRSLEELEPFMGDEATATDPWGRPYKLLCGRALPAGAKGIGVMSLGADGRAGTDDDVESWDDKRITREH